MVLPSLLMRIFCFYTDFGIEYEIVIKPNDTFIDGYCRSVFQIKNFFLFLLPLCHQHRWKPFVQRGSRGGGSKVGGGSKAPPHQPHPQPLPEREGSGCAQ